MKKLSRKKLFSVKAKDCEWEYYRGSGAGGQKRNKTSNAVRCKHVPSNAIGQSQEQRSQIQNRRLAFKRMAETKEFKQWIKIEASRISGACDMAMHYAEKEINSDNIYIEIKKDGKWIAEVE